MRRIPWHIAIRLNRKGGMTATGVALGVAFALISLTVAGGLQAATSVVGANHVARESVIFRADLSPIPREVLAAHPSAVQGRLLSALTVDGRDVLLASIPGVVLTDGVAVPATGLSAPLRLAYPSADLPAASADQAFPVVRADYFVSMTTIETLGATETNLLLASALPVEDAASLRERGYIVEMSPALDRFFFDSGDEVARDLLLVIAFSTVLVTVFAYEFMASEIRESRRDIGLWRALGLRSTDVTVMLLGRCAVTCAMGLSGGAVLSFLALATAARVTQSEIVRHLPSSGVLSAVFASSILAVLAGALVPAVRAAYSDVTASLEVAA